MVALILILGSTYRLYSSADLLPFVNVAAMLAFCRMGVISFAMTERIDESDDPLISQEAATSQSAILFLISNAFFSSTVTGTALSVRRAISGQNRFCG